MATILSAGTGAWGSGATWVGGVMPGNGDRGSIEVGHTVTIYSASQALGITVNGGHIVFENNFTFTDAPYAGLIINPVATSAVTSNGTAAAPRILTSSSVNPMNPWTIMAYSMAGFDSRTLDFDFMEMRGNLWFLGYGPPGGGSIIGLYFNNPNISTGSWMNVVPPVGRDPVLIEHPIDGRSTSRIYQRGSHAGAITIAGFIPIASWDYITIRKLQESNQRLSLFTRYHHYPKLRFDGKPRFDPKPGFLYVPFSISLVEDL